jgi:hypothetical protein
MVNPKSASGDEVKLPSLSERDSKRFIGPRAEASPTVALSYTIS